MTYCLRGYMLTTPKKRGGSLTFDVYASRFGLCWAGYKTIVRYDPKDAREPGNVSTSYSAKSRTSSVNFANSAAKKPIPRSVTGFLKPGNKSHKSEPL